MRVTFPIAALTVLALQTASAQAPAITWGPAPAVFPAGAKMAVLQGDPGQPALFTVRLEMPDGYRIPSHFHPSDEYITVIQGTFLVGMGDKLDAAQTNPLAQGAFATAHAGQHHFAIAKGRTIVQVTAMGPFALTYVNPSEDPQHVAKSR